MSTKVHTSNATFTDQYTTPDWLMQEMQRIADMQSRQMYNPYLMSPQYAPFQRSRSDILVDEIGASHDRLMQNFARLVPILDSNDPHEEGCKAWRHWWARHRPALSSHR